MENSAEKISKRSIAVFVLGCLTFFFFILAAIPAIILGALELKRIACRKASQKGRIFAVLGIIFAAVFLIPSFILWAPLVTGSILFQRTADKARIQIAIEQMEAFGTALNQYYEENGFYPSNEQGLDALVKKPTTSPVPLYYPESGYLRGGRIPKDPFGCDYVYSSPGIQGKEYEIYFLGGDCQKGDL